MSGRGAERILTMGGIVDPVLAHLAPLGLAAAAGSALVVDLDPAAPPLPGRRSVAELLEDGPRGEDLVPRRPGTAVLPSGGAGVPDGWPLVERLARGWKRVVVRLSPADAGAPPGGAYVPVHPLLPGPLAPPLMRPAVYQAMLPGVRGVGPGTLLLPPLARGALVRMLDGVVEPRSRWVRAWAPVWRMPWR
jgi:hypothetical protein